MQFPANPFDPSSKMLRQFAGLWIVFFLALAAWQGFQGRPSVAAVLAALAVTVGPSGLIWPRGIRPVFIGWMVLAYPVGWIVSHVMLTVVYHGLFTPTALIFRIIGRDVLKVRRQGEGSTYWTSRPGASDASQYLRQF